LAGDPEKINPDIPIEEQIDLLPYDVNWEFPRERLDIGEFFFLNLNKNNKYNKNLNMKTGKQLGAGQFGVVFHGQQIGSVHDLKDKQLRKVAVKMIKSASDTSAIKSLLSELKILIHLGAHLNVVNLLGACTKGIADGW